MSKKKISFLLLLLSLISTSTGCFIYHKPEYKGQILDIDTKAPIQEAVVVAVYNKQTMGLGAGAFSSIINVQEALTDSSGAFCVPSYTTLINPFSWSADTVFIVYKPGYESLQVGLEEYFTGRGKYSREIHSMRNVHSVISISESGAVGLPKLNTMEERLNALPVLPGPRIPLKRMKYLLRMHNEEAALLGLDPIK